MSDWEEILKKIGYPTTAFTLDFETYYDTNYSLKKMSTIEYVCDSRFEITGLGYQIIGNNAVFLEPQQVQEFLDYLSRDGDDCPQYTIVGQNLRFDGAILAERFGITPRYTIDLIDLERIWDAKAKHSLAAMAKRWNAPSLKGDTQQFKGYRWADKACVSSPLALMDSDMRESLREYCKNDLEIESFLFQKLLPLIPNPEIELPLATQTLHLYLQPQIQIDMQLGQELKKKMKLEMLKPRLELRKLGVKAGRKAISGNKKFTQLLGQYVDVPMKQGKNEMIPALAKDDEGLKQLLKNSKPEVRLLAESRKAVKSWPLHIARVDNLMNQAKIRNGLIGSPLSFHTAHTGRWGGTEGINLQNLGGRGRGGAGTHPLIQQIRTMLKAPDNYVFGIVDYAQIEACVLAWLAGQEDLIRGFAEGQDIYSQFATVLFGSPVRKKRESDPPPVAKLLTIRRGFGKDAVLGCGYGMGALKFYSRCRANDDLRPMIDSGQYDFDFIEKLIKTYRQKYSKIPAFWRQVEKAWRFVTKYPKEVVDQLQPWYGAEPPGLRFYNQNKATFIVLPSGRYLRYPEARVKRDGGLAYRWNSNIWGGFLTENVVQAVARDIMGKALLKLQNVVLHVHDEIVCLFKKSEAEQKLKEMTEIVSVVPAWAKGLPIDVEGQLSERYCK